MAELNKDVVRRIAALDLLKRNKDYYDPYEYERIKYYIEHDKSDENFTRDIMREIYDELGMIPEDQNMYTRFMQEIDENFGINNRHIIEVGGGIFPRLGHRIHLQQQNGTITVYDPRIGKRIEGDDTFILKREEFTRKTPLGNCNLLIGLMPCKGAEPLIDQAIKHEKDFMLWFCEGGPHGDCYDYFEDEREWLGSMMYDIERGVREHHMGKVIQKTLDKYSHYPIVYNQREK